MKSKTIKVEEMVIDGITYVPKESVAKMSESVDGMEYCVVRTYSAGVHIGYVKEFGDKHPQHAKLINSRRLHYWANACSLSQVAIDGVDADGSRVAIELPKIELTDVVEVIQCSEKAANFFKTVEAWKK